MELPHGADTHDMRAACAAALLALTLSGCGESADPAKKRDRPNVQAALPRLTRDLVPDSALRTLRPGDMRVRECGITPTFPCTSAFFAFPAGVAPLRRLAVRRGWRVHGTERFKTGMLVNLVRGEFQARYTVMAGLTGPRSSFVQLQVYGPAVPLPRPSAAERRGWSKAKERYVSAANAVCARTLRRLTNPKDVAGVLADLSKQLSALKPPPGERDDVETFLRPLRYLARSAEALAHEKGEEALPAAVGVGEFTKRFVRAASRYGLDDCAVL